MAITYTKLRDGAWGLRADGGDGLTAGAVVTVLKKSGETKAETVGPVLFSGNGVTLARIAGGSSGAGGGRCADCGKSGRLVRDLEDGLLKHVGCCDMPPGGY